MQDRDGRQVLRPEDQGHDAVPLHQEQVHGHQRHAEQAAAHGQGDAGKGLLIRGPLPGQEGKDHLAKQGARDQGADAVDNLPGHVVPAHGGFAVDSIQYVDVAAIVQDGADGHAGKGQTVAPVADPGLGETRPGQAPGQGPADEESLARGLDQLEQGQNRQGQSQEHACQTMGAAQKA